jgi:hypothetical protein
MALHDMVKNIDSAICIRLINEIIKDVGIIIFLLVEV